MADSRAKLPLDSPGARMYVGVPMSSRTRRCLVLMLPVAYWCRVTCAAGSRKMSNREVVLVLSWRRKVSLPSLVAPAPTSCLVCGRPPTMANICGRVSTTFTGRPSCRAARAARRTCDHADPLHPNPPPTNLVRTRTFSGGSENAFATFLRTPKIPCVAS